jgi:aryl-alcohol dehydrogenase-like predicted oxidoreductase
MVDTAKALADLQAKGLIKQVGWGVVGAAPAAGAVLAPAA